MIQAPWTAEHVEALNYAQQSGLIHPYTCGGEKCRANLIATVDGWVCPNCDYTQNWSHAPASREMLDAMDWRKSKRAE